MTDNTPVVPTDAEIGALGHRMCWRYKHDTGVNHISTFTFHAQTLHDFARAVLAKWGRAAQEARAMTDTTPVMPTDDEIDAVVQTCRERGLRELDVFRAVLAKWSTPTAGEPMACGPLIRQMRDALSLPCDRWNATQSRIVREAIEAADAWLEGKK